MEKNILAYFHSPQEAGEVQAKLQALRVTETRIDRVPRYPGDAPNIQMNPATGQMSSLSELTQGVMPLSSEAGVLMSADPAASGLSDGGAGSVTGRDILLTAVVDDSVHHMALRLIEEAGGMI